MISADPLYFFGVTVADSEELQQAFSECQSLKEMMELMRYEGLDLSLEQLRKFASRHEEPWWPWAGQSELWKHNFFRGSSSAAGQFSLLSPLVDLIGMALPRRGGSARRRLA
ncbi:MAG: hypothetical protein ACK55X_12845 [Synechococcaceae cyanobacterium]